LLVYTFSMLSMGIAHLCAAASDAGRINPSWQARCNRMVLPECTSPTSPTSPSSPKRTVVAAAPRRCPFCVDHLWKPARANHCRSCNTCVFRRHHHCTWIRNCVGWGNLKVFLVFLSYAMIALGTSLALLLNGACCHLSRLWRGSLPGERPLLCLYCCSCAAVASGAGFLWAAAGLKAQLRCLRENRTPLEEVRGLQGDPAAANLQQQLREVFGPKWWLWPLPFPAGTKPNYSEQVFYTHPLTGNFGVAPNSALSTSTEGWEHRKPQSQNRTLLSTIEHSGVFKRRK